MAKGDASQQEPKPQCGIVMPISDSPGYPAGHWTAVKSIIIEALANDFLAELVSIADDTRVIQDTIVQNLYDNPVVVCDISGRNANVMLELGMRLAFDKAVVVIKDSATENPFDTSPIEYLGYPPDLNYHAIVQFKADLLAKTLSTYKASQEAGYSPFLKTFGRVMLAKIDEKEVPGQEFILEELKSMREEMQADRNQLASMAKSVNELVRSSAERTSYFPLNTTGAGSLFASGAYRPLVFSRPGVPDTGFLGIGSTTNTDKK